MITLCSDSASKCPILPGHPEQVDWNLTFPVSISGKKGLEALRAVRDEVKRLVGDLFDRGYLNALVNAKCCADMILDNISDGIIAHDLDRKIFFFNEAAEKITGYRRNDVLGKDCHDIFPGKFCGGKCKFCEENVTIKKPLEQELDCITADGERRRLEMTVKMMVDSEGSEIGVLVSFHDATRERELARRLGERDHFAGIIGRDKKMLEVYDLIRDLADTDAPVLIQGDSGTGKELVAAAVHNEGPESVEPLCSGELRCSA